MSDRGTDGSLFVAEVEVKLEIIDEEHENNVKEKTCGDQEKAHALWTMEIKASETAHVSLASLPSMPFFPH
jgi:hypothetical protein